MLMSAASDTVTQSISVLSHSALTSDERDEYLRGLVRVLTSPDPGLRLTSSHALADLGGSTAVQALEMALAKEEDKTVRMAMERDVHRLKEKR
jgi:HEAT repeat protein